MDGMDKITFTSQLTQALQKLPHTSDDVEGAAIIVQALDDVKAVLTSTFPQLTAQQQQVTDKVFAINNSTAHTTYVM
jgi:hypothetical protein